MVERIFRACSAFRNLKTTALVSDAPGVTVSDRDGMGLATIIVRRGQLEALERQVREQYRIELPRGNGRAADHEFAFMGLAPGNWLASSEHNGNDFSASLRMDVGALASVSDHSDGYAVLELSGPKVRETLAKLVPIDIHPRAFRLGQVASTLASHMSATLWRLDDTSDGSPVYGIAVFRSQAAEFWHALSMSAAEFGITIR